MQISVFQICIRDISFSYKIEISTFKIEISVFQLQIYLFSSSGTEELFTNVHKPIETMPYFLLTLLLVSLSSLLWQSV